MRPSLLVGILSGNESLPKARQPSQAFSRCEAGISALEERHEHICLSSRSRSGPSCSLGTRTSGRLSGWSAARSAA
jgi:hypothetical protein